MDEKNNFALVAKPPSSLQKTETGPKRLLSGMTVDMLTLAKPSPSTLARAKFRIGDHELCEPDYQQILRWAKALELKPEKVIEQLLKGRTSGKDFWGETRFIGGRLLKINWDFDLLPLRHFEWVDGLAWIFHKLRAATSSPPINTPLQRGVAVKTTFKPFQRFEQCAENR